MIAERAGSGLTARRGRRIGVAVAAAATAALALSGCAAGQDAQTAKATPVVDGVAADAGLVALRAVTVAAPTNDSYPKGSDATLQLVIVNDADTADRLIEVSTSAASEVRMFANAADAEATPTPPPTPTSTPTGSTPAGSPSTPGTSTPGTSTPGSPTQGTPTPTTSAPSQTAPPTIDAIDLPAGRATPIGYSPDMPVIQLHGLTRQLFPAESFPITFQFANAGATTFTVAVHLAPPPQVIPTLDVEPSNAVG